MEFKISSPSFSEGGLIPSRHTCDGKNISPALEWTNPPVGTVSFVLIVDDPDAPAGDWVHWIVFNIPPGTNKLKEESTSKNLPAGAVEGINDFRKNNYGGPCPPSGTHRYYFKLYALDKVLELKASAGKKELLAAMKGDILGSATLMGIYKRMH